MKALKEIMKKSDPTFDVVDKRVVIYHDEGFEWCRDAWDHTFTLWSNHRDYRGDAGAKCPFVENDAGDYELPEGTIAYPVSIYDHSGLRFSLGTGQGFPDYKWDVTTGAFWLYVTREKYDKRNGAGAFDKVKPEEWVRIARDEVKELNLDEDGCWYGYTVEKRTEWVKTYADGRTVEGADYEQEDGCGGFLVDKAESIDFPRDLPVYAEDDTYMAGEEYTADIADKEVAA